MANIFLILSDLVKELVFDQDFTDFPFWSFFMSDSPLFDKQFDSLERIGGTLSHLQNELKQELIQFKGVKVTKEQKFRFSLAKNFILIFE